MNFTYFVIKFPWFYWARHHYSDFHHASNRNSSENDAYNTNFVYIFPQNRCNKHPLGRYLAPWLPKDRNWTRSKSRLAGLDLRHVWHQQVNYSHRAIWRVLRPISSRAWYKSTVWLW